MNDGLIGETDFVFSRDGANGRIMRAGEIEMVESQGNYIVLRLSGGQSIIVRKQLYIYEKKLDKRVFFQAGRGCIVNLAKVKKVELLDPKRFLFKMDGGRKVILSRERSVQFRKAFSI